VKTTDELRAMFKEKYPDIQVIRQLEIHHLIYLIDLELEKRRQDTSVFMYMNPLNRYVANMLQNKGIAYKGLELKVRSHYFNNREAITFYKGGTVGFCGWAGGRNHEPFLQAFENWLDCSLEARPE